MNNWKTDFEVKFHLEFTHVNGKKEAKYNSLIVEAENEEKAVEMVTYLIIFVKTTAYGF